VSSVERERLGPVEVLRLNRSERSNAMDAVLLGELLGAEKELGGDETLGDPIFSTTSERALCAGADVSERLDEAGGVARVEGFASLYAAVEAFPAPTPRGVRGQLRRRGSRAGRRLR